ncbi:hypothetical protein JCM9279_005915 [Rhodotorula babjevae]
MADYFSMGEGRSDELHGLGDGLLTPAEEIGYLSPLDSPASPNVAQQIREAASIPLADDAERAVLATLAAERDRDSSSAPPGSTSSTTGGGKGATLTPSQLSTVLSQAPLPAPSAEARFLHGGPPLSDLEAPSAVLPNSERRHKPIANSEWRAFTDEEEDRLQKGWDRLQGDQQAMRRFREEHANREKAERERDGAAAKKDKGVSKGEGSLKRASEDDADPEDSPYLVPVGLDNLFTVSLYSRILYPAFWHGTAVRVHLSHWFYAPPSIAANAGALPSHKVKPYPVDPSLSASLDRAFAQIRPWDPAYEAELASALKGGKEAQQRLAVALGIANESGSDDSSGGIEVIFESAARGRVYSRGMMGSMSKSFWSSGKALGGGQVVLRGWDAMKDYLKEKSAAKKTAAKPAPPLPADPAQTSSASTTDSTAPATPRKGRERAVSNSSSIADSTSTPKRDESPARGLFASLRSRIIGAPAPTDGAEATTTTTTTSAPTSARTSIDGESLAGAKAPNETQEALQLSEEQIGVPDELVLVIHGIGQHLAKEYDSFSFVHAVNAFRSSCTTLSQSDTLSPVLSGKRAQFCPVLWRGDLNFDEVDDSQDSVDEHLANNFTLSDIEVKGSVPFLRQVVSGLVLDVPMYLSPRHKDQMIKSVVKEANRIYRLFVRRNPDFEKRGGKVSIIAHSLGSCLAADILSSQPTRVADPTASYAPRTPGPRATAPPGLLQGQGEEYTFAFDTSTLILVGSPLGFFLQLGKGQLIARAGRARTKGVGRDIALDRSGRYGCLSCDTVYNVYHEADPVAFCLNAAVDARYAKLIKPVPIPSSTQSLLTNVSNAYHRLGKMFDVSSLWGGTSAASAAKMAEPDEKDAKAQADKTSEAQAHAAAQGKAAADAAAEMEAASSASTASAGAKPRPKGRPQGMKRMPSERPRFGMGRNEFEWVGRAEKRMRALNPGCSVDHFLPAEGLNAYIDAITAHGSYWTDQRFSTFVLTQLFSDPQRLEENGREQVGIEEEDEPHEA